MTPTTSVSAGFLAKTVTLLSAVLVGLSISACGPYSVMYHSRTQEPIVIQESAYSDSGCRENLQEEANRTGMILRSADVKGWVFGDTLLWPFVKGYVCVGTYRELPRGIVGRPSLYNG